MEEAFDQSSGTSANSLKIRPVFAVLLGLFCSSCVSLKTPDRADLVPLQAPMAIGNYPVSIPRTITSKSGKDTIIPTVIWYFFNNSDDPVTSELAQATHLGLNLTDKKHLTATLYNGAIPLKTSVLKGRLKHGYFRMKHDLSLSGVPPFYWSMTSAKKQIGIGKEKQLFIDHANETNGSILIMVAGTPGFTTSHTVPVYEK